MRDLSRLGDNVFVINMATNELVYRGHNSLTATARERIVRFLIDEAVDTPDFIALDSIAKLNSETAAQMTALKAEFARVQITADGKLRSQPTTARYVALVSPGTGTGIVRGFGLFDSAEDVDVVSAADATTNWTSGNALTVNTDDYREGTGSLQSVGTAALSFRNELLAVGITGKTTSDYLQFWYYIDDVDFLPAGGLEFELSSNTADGSDQYAFTVAKADLSDGWNWISEQISGATATGSPNLDAIVRFRLFTTGVKSSSATEKLDHIRLFSKNGNLWAHSSPITAITKGIHETLGVYWFITAEEGTLEETFSTYAKETVIVSTSAIGLDSTVYQPANEEGPKRAVIFVADQPIRYWRTGDTPTATSGVHVNANTLLIVEGLDDIDNFLAIRENVTDATMYVEYER